MNNITSEQMAETIAAIRGDSWASVAVDITQWSSGEAQTSVRVMTEGRYGNGETIEAALAEWKAADPKARMLKEAAGLESRAAELRTKAAELEKAQQ